MIKHHIDCPDDTDHLKYENLETSVKISLENTYLIRKECEHQFIARRKV